jgi:hypothetical protein
MFRAASSYIAFLVDGDDGGGVDASALSGSVTVVVVTVAIVVRPEMARKDGYDSMKEGDRVR